MDTFITDKFIHRENLALFKRLIAEADMRREILVKLLAEEEAKDDGGGTEQGGVVTAQMPT